MDQVVDKVFFDFDSTLLRAESLDILSEMRGAGEEARLLTARSMNGEIPLKSALSRKMDVLHPSRSDIQELVQRCEGLFVEDAEEVIRSLRFLGKGVFVLSSNFHSIIDPLVSRVGILKEEVFANEMYFGADGVYLGIDEESPLCADGGKAVVLRSCVREGECVVFVGDGSPDACTKGVADLFIGFGGIVRRPFVEERADVYITSPALSALLPIILQTYEIEKLRKNGFGKLLDVIR